MRSVACVALGAVALAACGGGGGGGGGAASCTPGTSATLTVNDTGFPNGANNACVLPAGTVTFTNAGASAHAFNFDSATDCPATPVTVPPNSSSAPVTFPNAATCKFHVDSNAAESGTVAVTNAMVSGGGY